MNTKRSMMLLIAAAAVLSAAGCGKKEQEVTVESEPEPAVTVSSTGKKIGISFPDADLLRWQKDAAYFTEEFKSKGYDVTVSYAGNDAAQQKTDISGLLSNGCDLLIVAPVDADALGSVMTQAGSSGIPVISYDELILNTPVLSAYVGFDESGAGKMTADYVIDRLGLKEGDTSKEYTAEYAACTVGDSPVGYVYNGIYDELSSYISTDVLLTLSGESTFSEALTEGEIAAVSESEPDQLAAAQEAEETAVLDVQKTQQKRLEKILSSAYGNTQLNALLCTDEVSSCAAASALNSYSGKNDVILAGVGVNEAVLANLVDGKQSAAVFEPTDELRPVTVSLAVSILLGESPDETLLEKNSWGDECRYDTGSYDNGSGVVAAYLVEPVLITADTITSKLVDTGYYTMDGKYPEEAVN